MRLSALEQQVAALALALVAERERTVEHRLAVLENALHVLSDPSCSIPSLASPEETERGMPRIRAPRQLNPAEQRARSRMPALIEYSNMQEGYVIVSSLDGELPILPNSPEWFELLATLRSCALRRTSWTVHCLS